MAKNLYILESPASSEYNMETSAEGKTFNYIKLLPLDYFEQTPDKTEEKGETVISHERITADRKSFFLSFFIRISTLPL